MIFRRSGAVLLRNPNFCDFLGVGGGWGPDPLSPPLDQCLKYFAKTCGNIGDIMSKKYAEERIKKNRDYLKTILLSIRYSHAPGNIFSSKKS